MPGTSLAFLTVKTCVLTRFSANKTIKKAAEVEIVWAALLSLRSTYLEIDQTAVSFLCQTALFVRVSFGAHFFWLTTTR